MSFEPSFEGNYYIKLDETYNRPLFQNFYFNLVNTQNYRYWLKKLLGNAREIDQDFFGNVVDISVFVNDVAQLE